MSVVVSLSRRGLQVFSCISSGVMRMGVFNVSKPLSTLLSAHIAIGSLHTLSIGIILFPFTLNVSESSMNTTDTPMVAL